MFFITTMRPSGRPNTCPLLAVWHDEALFFCTGETEQKARNIARNRQVTLATGNGVDAEGFDLVIEGDAVFERDEALLVLVARRWAAKFPGWNFEVRDGAFWTEGGGPADVYRVAPAKVLGFGKGDAPGQMRWTFGEDR